MYSIPSFIRALVQGIRENASPSGEVVNIADRKMYSFNNDTLMVVVSEDSFRVLLVPEHGAVETVKEGFFESKVIAFA